MRQVPSSNNYYRQIITLFILIMVDELGFWILLPVLAPLVSSTSNNFLGAHTSVAMHHLFFGAIMAATPFCAIIGAPILGFISDQLGRKKVLTICLTGTFFGFVLYAFSFWYMNLILLIIARIIVGLTTASQGIVQATMADLSEGRQKAINISMIACAMTLPLVVGPLLGGFLSDASLVSWFNRSIPFIFITILSFINLLMLLICFKETLITKNNSVSFKDYLPAAANFFRQPKLKSLLVAFFLMELGWSLYFQGIPLFLVQEWHFTSSQVGSFSSYIGACMALALVFLTRIALHFLSVSKLLIITLIITTLALLAGFILPVQAIIWLTAVPIAIGVGLSYTTLITLLSDAVPANSQGLLMGLTDSLLYLAFACTGLLAGILTIKYASLPILVASLFMLASYIMTIKKVLKTNL